MRNLSEHMKCKSFGPIEQLNILHDNNYSIHIFNLIMQHVQFNVYSE